MRWVPQKTGWYFPAILLAGFTVFFYWRVLFTSRFMFPWDAADFFYPYFAFVHEELRHLRLPFWNPYVMSGYPIVGDMEAQIFYPINWLFVLINPFSPLPYRLVEIQVILHFFLAGLFMYLLARDFVESEIAALLAGVLFMCSGAMIAHTQHVASINAMAWYPLIFLVARRALLRQNWFYAICAGMLLGIQLLAGHWQHSAYLGLFLFLYFAYEACFGPLRANWWPRWLFTLLVIAGLGAALAMVQIIPSAQLGFLSVRTYLTYWDVSVGNEPRFLWTLVFPNFFGGINGVPQWYPYDLSFNYVFLTLPGVLFAIGGLVETVRQRNFFWLGAVLLFVELSFGNQGHLAWLVYRIPVLNMFRVMAAFFDLANFSLCLMAAIGTQSILGKLSSRQLWKYISPGLISFFLLFAGMGLVFPLSQIIPDWYHWLAVFALFTIIVTARLKDRIGSPLAQGAMLILIVFEFSYYNRNQKFNLSPDDPRTFLSYEYAVGRKESLQFLRSDGGDDFRATAYAEFQWSGNGWNVWRMPGILGWNPLTLRRYDEYMRGFSHSSNVRLPSGGEDHHFNSPLLDLLGVKYLVLANPEREQALGLTPPKFRRVFEDFNWWRIYQNDAYFPKVRFFPKAYMLPDATNAFALMSSPWFDPRRFLLLTEGEFHGEGEERVEKLAVIRLQPHENMERSNGQFLLDPYCAEKIPIIGGWGRQGDWIRLDVPGSDEGGRYRLLARYTANEQAIPSLGLSLLARRYPWYEEALPTRPQLEVQLENRNGFQQSGLVSLLRTQGWPCHVSRTVDLGEFEMTGGQNRITITSREESALILYSFSLIRLPASPSSVVEDSSFSNFSISANHFSLDGRTGQDGFILVNEIHYPGWKAIVDGRPVEILQADGIFRGIYLPAGSHHIEFHFQPDGFAWGAAISLLTMTAFFAYVIFHRRRKKLLPP